MQFNTPPTPLLRKKTKEKKTTQQQQQQQHRSLVEIIIKCILYAEMHIRTTNSIPD